MKPFNTFALITLSIVIIGQLVYNVIHEPRPTPYIYNVNITDHFDSNRLINDIEKYYDITQGLVASVRHEVCNRTEKSIGCMYNNYITPYNVIMFPEKNDNLSYRISSVYNNITYVPKWTLGTNQVILIIGRMPDVRFFNFHNYLMERNNYWFYRFIFGSLGNSVNNKRIRMNNDTFVIISSVNAIHDEYVNDMVLKYYNQVNYLDFPKTVKGEFFDTNLRYTYQDSPDLFSIISRTALPNNKTTYNEFLNNPTINVWKLTYKYPLTMHNQYLKKYNELIPDTTNNNELHLRPLIDNLRHELISTIHESYPDHNIFTNWMTISGLDMINVNTGGKSISDYLCTYAVGDSGDTVYMTSLPHFVLYPDDVLIIFGVDHYSMNNTMYSAVQLYNIGKLQSILAIDDTEFNNTASEFMKSDEYNNLFVYAIAHNCTKYYEMRRTKYIRKTRTRCKEIDMNIGPTKYTDVLGVMGRDYNSIRYDIPQTIPFKYMIITRQNIPYRISLFVILQILIGYSRWIVTIILTLSIIYGVRLCRTYCKRMNNNYWKKIQ